MDATVCISALRSQAVALGDFNSFQTAISTSIINVMSVIE